MPAADTMTMQKWPDTLNLAAKFYKRWVWHIFAFDSRITFEAKVVLMHLSSRLIGKMSHSISAAIKRRAGFAHQRLSDFFLQVRSTFCFSFWQLGLFTSILCRFQTNLQCKHSGKYKMRWIVVLVRPRMVERRERVIKWAGVHFCEAKKQDIVEMRAALVLLVMIVRLGDAQRRVIGDNQEQRISQVRNHKRPCIYFQKWRPMREDTALIWKILTTSKQTLTSEKRGFTDGPPPTSSLPARLLDLLQFIRWVHLLLIVMITIMTYS